MAINKGFNKVLSNLILLLLQCPIKTQTYSVDLVDEESRNIYKTVNSSLIVCV